MLTGEPWCYSPDDVADMQVWHAVNLVLYPRDDKGRLLPLDKDAPKQKLTQEQWFIRQHVSMGFTERQARNFWAENLKVQHGRSKRNS